MDETDTIRPRRAPRRCRTRVIEQIFTQPYCRIGNLVERGIAERQAASTYLKEL